jgi:PPK2 family polyphosphate:nucleotide phosphotransferase
MTAFDRYRVEPGRRLSLGSIDPADTSECPDEERAKEALRERRDRIVELQERLYAEDSRALLVVLQGTDASGKDGTVKRVFNGTNPAGVRAYAFKVPTETEREHDFLWRYHTHTPQDGMIHIFNRSHYEDVLAVRVRELEPEEVWRHRYDSINDFERMLVREGTTIVKFFLHISKEEQRERLLERATNPEKRWKFSPDDVAERASWDAYQEVYEAAVRATSSAAAPWYAIPADHKWMARTAVAQIVVHHLERMDPRYPEPGKEAARAAAEARALLEAEGA